MEYRVQETTTGQFEIVQICPVVVGTFSDEAMAEKVMGFLLADAEPAQSPTLPFPVEDCGVVPAASEWTEEKMASALLRCGAGEKVGDVARDMGLPMPPLRGRWAAYKRRQEAGAPPAGGTTLPAVTGRTETAVEMVTKAVAELQDQGSCRLCERPFTVTPERQDLCARCSDV